MNTEAKIWCLFHFLKYLSSTCKVDWGAWCKDKWHHLSLRGTQIHDQCLAPFWCGLHTVEPVRKCKPCIDAAVKFLKAKSSAHPKNLNTCPVREGHSSPRASWEAIREHPYGKHPMENQGPCP